METSLTCSFTAAAAFSFFVDAKMSSIALPFLPFLPPPAPAPSTPAAATAAAALSPPSDLRFCWPDAVLGPAPSHPPDTPSVVRCAHAQRRGEPP